MIHFMVQRVPCESARAPGPEAESASYERKEGCGWKGQYLIQAMPDSGNPARAQTPYPVAVALCGDYVCTWIRKGEGRGSRLGSMRLAAREIRLRRSRILAEGAQ